MRRKARATWLGVALLGIFAGPPVALAQSASPQTAEAKDAARVAANQGQALFDAGRYEEALSAFRDANRKFPAPTIKLAIALTYIHLGQLRKARSVYAEVSEERLAHYAPQEFFDAQTEAKKQMEALASRIPTLEVQVRGASGLDVELAIDGQPALLGDPIELDPGSHTVMATAPGYQTTTQPVDVKEGAAAKVMLEMKALPASPASGGILPAVPAEPAEARAHAAAGGSSLLVPAIAMFSAAGVAIAVGGASLSSAASETSAPSPGCRTSDCSSRDGRETAKTLETMATVSFAASGVLAATGVLLLLWGPDHSPQPAKAALVAGPGWVSVRGTF